MDDRLFAHIPVHTYRPNALMAGLPRMSSATDIRADWHSTVLDFWFGELGRAQWFERSDALDERIRSRFLGLYEHLSTRDAAAITDPRQMLAAVIVLDQLSRNMFRGTPRAFAADPLARQLARQLIDGGSDAAMTADERLFVYLPFEHSEDRADQALSVRLISQLGDASLTRYALAHQSIIERFGRFPHRNAILGRHSTPDELALLDEPMGSF